MTLLDPRFTKFDGTQVTGRVPANLIVAEGRELTNDQLVNVEHCYKLFRDALTTSVGDFLVQNRVLEDGTEVRMESMQDRDTVYVSPPDTGGNKTNIFRGFVVSPIKIDGETMPAHLDKNFLCYIYKDTKWKPFIAPFKPGEKRKDLGYLASAIAFDGKETKDATVRGRQVRSVTTYAGKKIRRWNPISDDRFNDVFAVYNKVMYRNAIAVKSFVAVPGESMPLPYKVTKTEGVKTWLEYDALFITNNRLLCVAQDVDDKDADLDTDEIIQQVVYDFLDFFEPIVPGLSFRTGVELRGNFKKVGDNETTDYKIGFLGYNKTAPGAIQTWTAAKLPQITHPWSTTLIEEFNQMGVPGAMNSNDGWTYTQADLTGIPPRFMTLTADQMKHGSLYIRTGAPGFGAAAYAFTGFFQFAQALARNGESSIWKYTFDKTHTQNESLKWNEADLVSVQREVVIHMVYTTGSANYYGIWPHSQALSTSNVGTYTLLDPSPGSTYNQGDLTPFANICSDNGEGMDQTDVSHCIVSLPLIPNNPVNITMSRSLSGIAGGTLLRAMTAQATADGTFVRDRDYMIIDNGGSTVSESYQSNSRAIVVVHTFIGITRDYIYADRANQVFVYLECEIRSNATHEWGRQGTSSITFRTVVEAFGSTHKTTVAGVSSESATTTRYIPTEMPWGIDFGASSLATNYHKTPRIDPIIVPKWLNQGLCPYISHTVADETAPPRLDCHFRLQFIKTVRQVDEPDPPELKNVVQFQPYLMEQMLGIYWLTINEFNDIFHALEAAPIIIKLSIPDATLFTNIGAPIDDAKDFAKFYRT